MFISMSATGYYGSRGDEILDESSTAGSGFLAELCRAWEAATAPARDRGVRVAYVRTGIVLGPRWRGARHATYRCSATWARGALLAQGASGRAGSPSMTPLHRVDDRRRERRSRRRGEPPSPRTRSGKRHLHRGALPAFGRSTEPPLSCPASSSWAPSASGSRTNSSSRASASSRVVSKAWALTWAHPDIDRRTAASEPSSVGGHRIRQDELRSFPRPTISRRSPRNDAPRR